MADHVIPVYRNDSGIEQFVPNDNGSCSRVPPGKAVKGDYYTGKLASPAWSSKTDGSYDSLIVYENLGELGNRLTFVPVPAASYSLGSQGQVAVKTTDAGAIDTIYVCWGPTALDRGTWNSSTVYNKGDAVTYSSAVYISLVDGANVGHTPGENAYWTATANVDRWTKSTGVDPSW